MALTELRRLCRRRGAGDAGGGATALIRPRIRTHLWPDAMEREHDVRSGHRPRALIRHRDAATAAATDQRQRREPTGSARNGWQPGDRRPIRRGGEHEPGLLGNELPAAYPIRLQSVL